MYSVINSEKIDLNDCLDEKISHGEQSEWPSLFHYSLFTKT